MPSARARLLRAHQVPESYREPGILSGYRPPRSSARECLRSLFGMNNETLNIWTHLVPAGYLLWLLVARLRDPGAAAAGPYLAYLGTCALYPLASSAAHALGALGGRGRHRAFCCDYAALSLYSLGSALAYSAYVFPLEWVGSTFHDFYVPVAVLNSALSTGLSCYSRFLEAERPSLSKAFRTVAFVYPYLFDSIPVFYRDGGMDQSRFCRQLFRSAAGSCSEASLPLHSRHSLCALLTFLSFTSHLPERLAPGSFDFIGHSHQVFHICGILGTLFQLEAVSVDMVERRGRLPLPSSLETFGSLGMGAAASLAILGPPPRASFPGKIPLESGIALDFWEQSHSRGVHGGIGSPGNISLGISQLHQFYPQMGWETLPIPLLSTGKMSNNRDLIPEKGGKRSCFLKNPGSLRSALGRNPGNVGIASWEIPGEAKHSLIPVFPLDVAFLWNSKP
ncbi:hypothetical protein DV515_00013702 [Chloebia gouldiae]|uniref:Progestin and adipoQ receptor family member VI n=1 Tax=Chloebia gouldiae TaxID=44316 RepID=A0A3L8S1F8_CHLGU|nr:hypothetical protein DV515_00013702 [Chloebia gouldiae]